MALKIRLMRTGRKNEPKYRVVVTESARKPQGGFIEIVGFYNPMIEPPIVKLDKDRINYWLEKGAKPSDTVRHLLS